MHSNPLLYRGYGDVQLLVVELLVLAKAVLLLVDDIVAD